MGERPVISRGELKRIVEEVYPLDGWQRGNAMAWANDETELVLLWLPDGRPHPGGLFGAIRNHLGLTEPVVVEVHDEP